MGTKDNKEMLWKQMNYSKPNPNPLFFNLVTYSELFSNGFNFGYFKEALLFKIN